jgi:pimeloyl-ACP methyl ester carboxylesterase
LKDARRDQLSVFEPATHRVVSGRSRIAIWEVGEGKPVLCVHGFPDHAISLRPLAETIARAGYKAVCPALPGYWPSDAVRDGDYRVSEVAKDMLSVLDDLGDATSVVVGHDWGAEVAYYLGAHHSDRLAGIVAISAPHPMGFETRRSVFSEQQSAWYALFLAFNPSAPSIAGAPTWLTALAQSWSPGFFWDDWPSILSMLARPGVLDAVCRYYHADLTGALDPAVVHVPATVIHGGQDGALSSTIFTGLDQWFGAGIAQHLLPTCGHWPHLERPEEVHALIVDAIERSFMLERSAPKVSVS